MNASTRLALFSLVLATLAGCGNKGPLVLPPPVSPPESADASPIDDGSGVQPPTSEAPPADESGDAPLQAPIDPPVDEDETPEEGDDDPSDDGSSSDEADANQDGGND